MKINYISQAIIIGLIAVVTLPGCKSTSADNLASELDSIARKWVPDKREGICEVTLENYDNTIVLKGETSIAEAKTEIIDFLVKRKADFIDSLIVLPDKAAIPEQTGLVTVSVCNIRLSPSQDAEMVSQAIMGTPVRILKEKRGWFLIQTPDRYLGWTEGESVKTMTPERYNGWKSARRVIYLNKSGDIFTDEKESGIVSDVVAGCILVTEGNKNGYQKVVLPDGRSGYCPDKFCADFEKWSEGLNPEPDEIIRTGFRFMGTPYLWGGTSSKGMDCSGFVKTVYFLNGMVLARDVSLQYNHVKHMTTKAFPDSLETGDLLFFGSVRDGRVRPTHVGIYIGDSEFIHCSGMVKVNSLDSTKANFSRYRMNTFLGAGRIIGQVPDIGTRLMEKHNWYN